MNDELFEAWIFSPDGSTFDEWLAHRTGQLTRPVPGEPIVYHTLEEFRGLAYLQSQLQNHVPTDAERSAMATAMQNTVGMLDERGVLPSSVLYLSALEPLARIIAPYDRHR